MAAALSSTLAARLKLAATLSLTLDAHLEMAAALSWTLAACHNMTATLASILVAQKEKIIVASKFRHYLMMNALHFARQILALLPFNSGFRLIVASFCGKIQSSEGEPSEAMPAEAA